MHNMELQRVECKIRWKYTSKQVNTRHKVVVKLHSEET